MSRIGFLFNHDQTHQVAHSLPIALEIARSGAAEVSLLVTNAMMKAAVEAMAGELLAKMTLIDLAPKSFVSRAAAGLLDRFIPAGKLSIYRDHLDLFRSFDALVVSEKSSLLLKTRYGLNDLKFVHTRHGAGDRAIGFNPESAKFDLILVAGPKIRDRLIAEAEVPPERIAVTGYCKFDQFLNDPAARKLFPNDRPVVLYNPHPSPKLSSWYLWGDYILDYFARQSRYNLIFAPHVMLFERNWTVTIDPPAIARVHKPGAHYSNLSHMLVDLGSDASVDMTYTNAADIYLGDVSSQVYEFLVKPRPCLFLNAHKVDWRNDASYTHWQAGPVVESVEALDVALSSAFEIFKKYRSRQEAMLEETFSVSETPAAQRGAQAILAMLKQSGKGQPQ
ncbi:MAG: hypothetical protein WA793_13660 [Sphingorhabdus sp.]|uniref:hypothetical protein n=1 Tax=Sphingorhabdus sp. TaxID=1902408 RepID=UPI003CA04C7B